ncbi:MAG: sulfide/dihydroorotate dehydrogenase-like FAD/NAD-binding protein [Phycisphaeraceae bacterium]|nr:sulfide/dihydroorotate dehydrogenase-like FAD/NAD-binding protein [Phycisphaeraceae bacterium]
MFPIVQAQFLAPDVKRFVIEAPRIAKAYRAGQFVILRVYDKGERVPLTISEADAAAGTIAIIVQGVGKTTKLLNTLEAGQSILDVVGPLGRPSEIKSYGTVVVIGGGVGTAIAYPTAVAMKKAGNRVVTILGARTKGLLILEEQLRSTSDELFVMTDDGSYGEKGLVTRKLAELVDGGAAIGLVLAIGPIPMMRAVAEATRPRTIHTMVSLNPIMVDGTGMCGGCRVMAGGKSQFACVDGPEFDAHEVDFGLLMQRNAMYREREKQELAEFEAQQQHATMCAEIGGACKVENQQR